jgi:hypothetical protein
MNHSLSNEQWPRGTSLGSRRTQRLLPREARRGKFLDPTSASILVYGSGGSFIEIEPGNLLCTRSRLIGRRTPAHERSYLNPHTSKSDFAGYLLRNRWFCPQSDRSSSTTEDPSPLFVAIDQQSPHENGSLEPLVTDADLARLLKISRSWIRKQRMLRRAGLPHALTVDAIMIGSVPRYRRADIQAWLDVR